MEDKCDCKYRQCGKESGVCYCRHGGVQILNNLVSLAICKNCPHKNREPNKLRPELTVEEIDGLVDKAKIDKQNPSLLTQASNAIQAITQTAKDAVFLNTIFATEDEAKKRWAICEGCDFKKGNTCSLCGCGLKTKTQLASQECPAGKWRAETKKPGKEPEKPGIPGKPKWAE